MDVSKSEKPRIIYRCGNQYCRAIITKTREFCTPCLKHYQIFRKNRRPKNQIKIVCSESTCFSSVLPKELQKHPVSESWICLSCYKKEVRQLEFQTEIKEGAAPKTQDPAPPEDPPGASISYEIYQEALKVYEELRKTEDLPSVAEDNFRFS